MSPLLDYSWSPLRQKHAFAAMRTKRDLPDDILRRTKHPRKRLDRPPIVLAADAPLRWLSLAAVKRRDAEDLRRSEERKVKVRTLNR